MDPDVWLEVNLNRIQDISSKLTIMFKDNFPWVP